MGKKSKTTQTVKYGNTTTSNPYAVASTNNDGTISSFQQGNALDLVYNFVNKNINSVLDEYLSPTLNSTTNQAKLNSFTNTLNSEAQKSLENNIINPLSNRNMLRSSQATDLYKNLSNSTTTALADYANELLANSQNNTAAILNNLLAAYLQGYNVISDTQNQSLATSNGNAEKTSVSTNNNMLGSSVFDTLLNNSLKAYSGNLFL